MLGEELPPPLELRKKRPRSVRIVKKDSRSIKTVRFTISLHFVAALIYSCRFSATYLNCMIKHHLLDFYYLNIFFLWKQKLSIGGTAEKIVSAFHLVLSEHANEDEELSKCKSAVHHVKKMEKDVDVALTKGKMTVNIKFLCWFRI